MSQQEIHKKIRNTVDSLLPGTRIVLFEEGCGILYHYFNRRPRD